MNAIPAAAPPRRLRAIIVEDRPDDLLLLLAALERASYTVTYRHVQSKRELHEALALDWDIVLSDFSLPSMTAHDVLSILKATRPDLPCIVISGTITEDAAVDVLRAGAVDFVVKERMARLVPAIERELRESGERRRLAQSDAALREMRQRMQFAMEAANVGVWESDMVSGRMFWSEVQERLHGLAPGTFAGTFAAFIDTIHPDDRDDVSTAIERSVRERTDSRLEYRSVWPDGSVHWLAGIGRVLHDEAGRAIRAVGVGMDMTERKTLEEHLRQAQKMESIGNLAGGIAHDFNNLLTVISAECELMADTVAPDSAAARSLASVRSAASSATALTRQLLTFSRRQVVVPKLTNLTEAINGFSQVLRRLVEESVRLEFNLVPRLDPVRIDPGQLEQVLLNLVANARDAMPLGGLVTIGTASVCTTEPITVAGILLPEGAWIHLWVTDTGSGITPDVRARLFEPFFTTKGVGVGTGLGLATVHGIVTQGGGHIAVDSKLGAGTTFHIYFPRVQSASAAAAEAVQRPATLDGSETVLVVEDNNALGRLAVRILGSHGYRVLLASTAQEAMAIAGSHDGPIDLVLTDVVMPGKSGPEVADAILKQRPAADVVFMSGYTSENHRLQGHVFVQKPFTAAQLLEAVRTSLDRGTRKGHQTA
jgi:PAS domain S-box-containing protein